MNETEARILIDGKLREAGWRLSDDANPNVRAGQRIADGGKNLEADYVLNNKDGFPLAVLEAKKGDSDPLVGKEQAREYAAKLNAPFVLLSNGNLHYFWEIAKSEPHTMETLPSPSDLEYRRALAPLPFTAETIARDYIAQAQGKNCPEHKRRNLYDYQMDAVRAVQKAAAKGRRGFLLEMATGTGKTLVSAALLKLFFATKNARRVLFVVDRLELQAQAKANLEDYFGGSWRVAVLRENRDDWNKAHVVISTAQFLIAEDRYKKKFSPLSFDLVVVDEAHRAIVGRGARKMFDFFCASKLGLTATPKDYLRGMERTPAAIASREYEARRLLDTYKTFGCENNEPTYRYNLEAGAKGGFLVLPQTLDIRTHITADMLSERGVAYSVPDNELKGDDEEKRMRRYFGGDYERTYFADATNEAMCEALFQYGLRDPLSDDLGKTIAYCVSQRHAAKIAAILNRMAAEKYPGRYQSDFAKQITSEVVGAQDMARSFANRTLGGKTRVQGLDDYDSDKTRVCATVGMLTTGYDCPDILNIGFMRPVFSPSEYIQMRGRGTRLHTFKWDGGGGKIFTKKKETFRLLDFFAVCEHMNEKHRYDQKLPLPGGDSDSNGGGPSGGGDLPPGEERAGAAVYKGGDAIDSVSEIFSTRADNQARAAAEDALRDDAELKNAAMQNLWEEAEAMCNSRHAKDMQTLRTLIGGGYERDLERKLTDAELLRLVFAKETADDLKTRNELLEEEWKNFLALKNLSEEGKSVVAAAAQMFKACLDDEEIFNIVADGEFAKLADTPALSMDIVKLIPSADMQKILDHLQTTPAKKILAAPTS